MRTTHEDWDPPDEAMPADLRDELAAPNVRKLADPRSMPARIHHLKAAGECGAKAFESFQADGGETLTHRLGNGTHALLTGKPCVLWDQPSQAWIKAREKALEAGEEAPPMSLAPRSGKSKEWIAFQRQHAGATILTRSEMDAARRMADAIHANGHAHRLLTASDVIFERTILWSQCGRARRSTPDMRKSDNKDGPSFVAEIKTTRCAAPGVFWRDARKFGYHAQLADQAAAIQHETGRAPRTAYIIAVEKPRPHVVQVYEVPAPILAKGAELVAMWSERLQIFEATNLWGGYSNRVETLEFLDESTGAVTVPFDPGDDGDEEDAAVD